ncbi:MAG: hypothetical protein ACRECO_07200, partial [Xanthobacteraceae bacterium]
MPPQDAANYSTEQIVYARERYADHSTTVEQIERETGMTSRTLYFFIDGAGGRFPPLPRRLRSRRKVQRAPAGDRKSFVTRLWRTAERQVRDIEDRLVGKRQQPDERERDTRMLAMLAKTLRELSALDETNTGLTDDNDDGPRDIDEFRRDLARRIDAFVESRVGAGLS